MRKCMDGKQRDDKFMMGRRGNDARRAALSMAKAIMLQGTGSDVGKTVLVAGLCRAARNRGLKVRPFKPQNMSNNAAVADIPGEAAAARSAGRNGCRRLPAASRRRST